MQNSFSLPKSDMMKMKGPLSKWVPDKKMQEQMMAWEKEGDVSTEGEAIKKEFERTKKEQELKQQQMKEQVEAKKRYNETVQMVKAYHEKMKMKRKRRGVAMSRAVGKLPLFNGGPTLIGSTRHEGGSTMKA